jgi:quercetin dioxygenase-like cupin family protein
MITTTSRSQGRRSLGYLALVWAVLGLVGAGVAVATPPSGTITRTELAKGTISESVTIQRSGPTDFYVQSVVVHPGASSGWHTHPGAEFSIVKSGTGTLVKASDCAPKTISAGQAFFIPGGLAHMARNDGPEPLEIYVTYTLVGGSAPRGDSDQPAGCPA